LVDSIGALSHGRLGASFTYVDLTDSRHLER
jgi:hypothetical protein